MYAERLLDRDLLAPSLPAGMQGGAVTSETVLFEGSRRSWPMAASANWLSSFEAANAAWTANSTRQTWELFHRIVLARAGAVYGQAFGGVAVNNVNASQVLEAAQTTGSISTMPRAKTINRFRTMLDAFRSSVSEGHYRALHRQLTALLDDEDEMIEASVRPSMVSFAALLQFLRRNGGLKHPGLSLDSQGRFVASWQPRGRAKLSITFTSLMSAKWIASDRSGTEPMRGSGPITGMSAGSIDERFCGWLFP